MASGSIFQTLLSIFASDILPIFLVASAGFLLARFSDVNVRTVARVVFNALAPCLVFNLLVTSTIPAVEFGRMVLYCILVTGGMGLLARIAAAPLDLDRASLAGFLLVVMFSNSGNYGLPVALFAFGREALTFATVYFVTSAVLAYTVGVLLAASGRRSVRQALAGLARVPAIYGIAAAAAALMSGAALPAGVMRPVMLLSDAAVPMMMLVLGMQLERATRPERPAVVGAAVALSLLGAPVVAFALAWLLGLSGPALQAGIIEASMPSAVMTTILALEFEVAPAFVTSVVLISTVLSPFTLTAIIAYLQRAG